MKPYKIVVLRGYQTRSVEDSFLALRNGHHPVVVIPTGGGKSLVIADIIQKIINNGGRVVILAHLDELLKQNIAELEELTGITDVGVLCSAMKRFDTDHPILFASIQTLNRRIDKIPQPDLIIIDEAHLVGLKNKMYPAVFKAWPDSRRIGLTATPTRLDGGLIYGKEEDKPFSALAYKVLVSDLVKAGYLSKLVGVTKQIQLDLKGVKMTAGDFNLGQVSERLQEDWLTEVLKNAIEHAKGRKHICVFLPTIETANLAAKILRSLGETADTITSKTEERGEVLERWKSGLVRWMTNVNILTTGFNFRALDCIVFLRPTASLTLWVQALGRGMRPFEGKPDCLVLDYVGNLERLGGVGMMDEEYIEVDGVLEKDSEEERKKRETKGRKKGWKDAELSDLDPMVGRHGMEMEVVDVDYIKIEGRERDKHLVMVKYEGKSSRTGYTYPVTEMVCVEHEGYARTMAEKWFVQRGVQAYKVPREVNSRLLQLMYSLPAPKKIWARKSGRYMNVVKAEF